MTHSDRQGGDVLSPVERAVVDIIRAGQLGDSVHVPETIPDDEWPALVDAALKHQLSPVLRASLKQLRMRDAMPEESDTRLSRSAMNAAYNAQQAEPVIAELQSTF